MIKDKTEQTNLPAYTRLVYGDVYNSLSSSISKDTQLSANLRSFFQYNRLVNAALNNIKINQKVLQLGLTFGDQIDRAASIVGAYGQLDVFDINKFQVARNQEKYGNIYPSLKIFCQDASTIKIKEEYDTVLCFFLLQELPPYTKAKVINNALAAVKPGGSVVFVDYHNPLFWHPLRYVVRMYNRLRHPFVEKMWDREINSYAKHRGDFIWRKSTYFGRMFQKVVATRKTSPLDEIVSAEMNKHDETYLPEF